MGLISRLFNFTAGTVIDSEQVDAELDQILGVLNGNVESANIKDGTVTSADLLDGTIVLADLSSALQNTFLKLASAADVKLAFGAVAINWPGGSALSNPLTVSHGLGGTPLGHLFYVVDQGGTGYCKACGGTQSGSQLTAIFETVGGFQPGAGNNGTAFWIALR